jgi:hypothetical protein
MKTIILEIGEAPTAQGYSCKLSLVGGQQPREEVLSSLNEQAIGAIPAAPDLIGVIGGRELGAVGAGGHGSASAEYAQHAEWLHDLVFRDEVLDKLKGFGVLAGGSKAISDCRLVLDIKAPPWRGLRFEMMAKGSNRPAMQPDCSVVRGPIDLEDRAAPGDGPIRVLVVVGSRPKDQDVLAEEEVAGLRKVLDRYQTELALRVLDRDGIKALIEESKGEIKNVRDAVKAAYKDYLPHVFHFIGHGKLGDDQMPYLALYDPNLPGENLQWKPKDMWVDFNRVPPAFIFLNACYTVSKVPTKDGRSIADIFLEEIGSRGVLGMHSAIRGETAGRLAGSLYRAFLEGQSLDLALTEARGDADILKGNDPAREWDWAIPYLRLKVLPDEVIPVRFVPTTWRDRIHRSKQFEENKYFIDRECHRDEFWKTVHINPRWQEKTPGPSSKKDPGPSSKKDPGPSSNVFLVRGKPDIGKTRLMCFCLEAAALSGRLLKYVDLSSKESLDWIGVLKRIVGGTQGSLISSPLPGDLFAKFNPTLDDAGHEKQEERIFEEFRAALWKVPAAAREARAKALEDDNESAAAARVRLDTRPFVLVLDQIVGPIDPRTGKRESGVIPALFEKSLIPGLIHPINARRERDLQLVLAVRERGRPNEPDEYEELGLDALDPKAPTVTLREIEGDLAFARFAEEYFLRKDIDAICRKYQVTTEFWKKSIDDRALLYRGGRCWSPRALERLYREIKSAIESIG